MEEQYKFRDMMARRKKMLDYLNLGCIFPSAMLENYSDTDEEVHSTTWRCLLDLHSIHTEGIVCRMFENCSDKTIAAFKVILSKLFNRLPVAKNVVLNFCTAVKPSTTALHPGLCCIYNYIEHSSNVFLIQEYMKHSGLSLSRCHTATSISSPTLGRPAGAGAKDIRLRFLVYQLLQVVSFIHSVGLCLHPFTPQKILLADDMWVTVLVSLSQRVQDCIHLEAENRNVSERTEHISHSHASDLQHSVEATYSASHHNQQSIPQSVGYRESLTSQWASRKISNFEYIMALNTGAGRSLIDPLYHPIMPWLTDFSVDLFSERDGFSHNILHHRNQPYVRDLTKSMFRLSKGDAQLETTYMHSDPPHHIPESLSELTYYIYMSRVTPMHVLRRVVRNDFVPEHYPHSMTRMYAWSPDECIPEFFTDVSTFKSIHSDVGLLNIELPSFAPTPEAFLSYHMKLLESDYVSAQLHHWIDLSFGICLSGQEAIDNMNIPLQHTTSAREHLGGAPNIDKHPGFVQLFFESHPSRHMFNHDSPHSEIEESSSHAAAVEPSAVVQGAEDESLASNHQKELNTTIHNLVSIDPKNVRRGKRNNNRNIANMSDKAKTVFFGDSVHDGRKYLDSDISDPSLTLLRNVPHISLKDDETCVKDEIVMKGLVSEKDFSCQYDLFVDPKYSLESNLLGADPYQQVDERECSDAAGDESADTLKCTAWDASFFDALENVRGAAANPNHGKKSKKQVNNSSLIREYQADDMYSVGCVLAEMYTGKPLLSRGQSVRLSRCRQTNNIGKYNRLLRLVLNTLSGSVPLVIRRLIASLLHFNPLQRPTAAEVLAATTSPNYDDWASGTFNGPCKDGVVHFLKKIPDAEDTNPYNRKQPAMIDFLFSFSPGAFPPYFFDVYTLVGRIKLCQRSKDTLNVITSNITQIQSMPIEGVGFLLPHITAILSNAEPFRECYDGQMELQYYESGRDAPLILQYICIVDVVGGRLGAEATEKILVPVIQSFFNTLNSTCVLRMFLYSSLWQVMVHRGGVKCFLRHFMPFLLTSLLSGTLQSIANRILSLGEPDFGYTCPLWATLGNVMPEDWLHGSSSDETQLVQQAAKVTISRLAYAENLGAGLTTRYILPALLCLVGIPQLSFAKNAEAYVASRATRAALFDNILDEDQLDEALFGSSPSRAVMVNRESCVLPSTTPPSSWHEVVDQPNTGESELLSMTTAAEKVANWSEVDRNNYIRDVIQDCTSFDNHGMYLNRTIQSLCTSIGELATAEVVLTKLFGSTLPHIRLADPSTTPSRSTVSAYKEVIYLLTSLLPGLSQETIIEYYLVPAKSSRSSIPQLLVDLPFVVPKQLITFNHHTDQVSSDEQLRAMIELNRYHLVQLDLCRLLVSCCMSVGSSVTIDVVLPQVNKFFGSLVETYQNYPVESVILQKAFKMGGELFVPLAQLVGDETFHTHVPHMNPRLELWLSSTYAGGPCYSPPLPSGIFPDTVYSNSEPEQKRKGFFSWMYKEKHAVQVAAVVKASAPNDSTAPPNSAAQIAQVATQNHDQLLNISAAHNITRKVLISENRVMSVDSAIVLQEYAIQMDRSSTLLQHTRKLTKGIASSHTLQGQGQGIQPLPAVPEGFHTPAKQSCGTEEDDHLMHPRHPSLAKSRNRGLSHSTTDSIEFADGETLSLSTFRSVTPSSDVGDGSITNEAVGTTVGCEGDDNVNHVSESLSSDLSLIGDTADPTAVPTPEPVDKATSNTSDSTSAIASNSAEFVYVESAEPPSNSPLLSNLLNAASPRRLPEGASLHKEDKAGTGGQKPGKDSVAVDRRVKNFGVNEEEDVDMEHSFYDECAWLLSGSGRWNMNTEEAKVAVLVDSERAEKDDKGEDMHGRKITKSPQRSSVSFAASIRSRDKHPAAQVSMTSPRIAVDGAVEAGCLFALQMQNNTQWQVEEPPLNPEKHGAPQNYSVKCMAVNASESLLATSSKTGVKLWSLSSQPIKQVGLYNSHSSAPYCMNFLRNGSQIATCDGSINIADIETQKSIAFLKGWSSGPDEKGGYSFMQTVSPRHGITPGLACHGDDQLMTCSGMDMTFFDFRARSVRPLRSVAEWKLPQILSTGTSLAFTGRSAVNTTTNGVRDIPHLTSAASNEDYVYSASSTGGLWVIDRRTGRVLQTCQGHSSSVLKVVSLSQYQFLSVCEKSACLWDCRHSEIKKLATIGHILDSSAGLTANTVLVHNFEFSANALSGHHYHDSGNSSGNGQGNNTAKPISVIYSLSGHKLCVGKIPSYNSAGIAESKMAFNYAPVNNNKEAGSNDGDEVKLDLAYFSDRKNNKLTKQKLQISSGALLPLRRLLLVGTDDGHVRVVS